jgi:transcriptional regulator with XRE-family HTH domain
MMQSYVDLPSLAAALLQLARLKADMSQRELAERGSVPTTMISAYERDKRQPSLTTLLRLLHAAGFELTMKLEPYDLHDEVLAGLERKRSPSERGKRDRQIEAWRQASPAAADLDDVIRSKEAAGRPKDLQTLPALYRYRSSLPGPGSGGSGAG